MINVNFFEKKKTNVLPYIVGGVFFILLLLMGGYFLLTNRHYQQVIEDNNEWLNTNSGAVVLSRQMNRLNQLENQSLDVQATLEENQYPMHTIAEEIVSVVPNEPTQIASFQLTEPNQLTFILENTEATTAQTIVGDLEALPFVTQVQFLYAENQSDEDGQLRWEMLIDLNPETLAEEVPQ